jgi:leucyl-tRNA synthetase
MHKKFDHTAIEKKWQSAWKESGIYTVGDRDKSKEKEYVLVEWPYPSGNLHIGHWFAFAVVDIYVRARRMEGKQVLFPMGFDAFGLPAENAAIKRGLDPKAWTESNIDFMRNQLGSMGNAFSWDKTTSSTDPDYYRWTQWMFTEFLKNDIAYRGKGKVNWCPGCNTVLANEQVLTNGTCERSGDVVEQREMTQWMLRITDFADALIDELDELDWPEHIKEAQRNWIGRSEGARITFPLSTGDSVDVFTTRADTLFGATALILAPEHPLLNTLKSHITNMTEVVAHQDATRIKKDDERTAEGKEKTGVRLEGVTATNPASKEDIPVFIADYVISTYGTGALMSVPAHDERDFAFAKKYEIPIYQVIDGLNSSHSLEYQFTGVFDLPYSGHGVLINSAEFNGMPSEEAKAKITEFVNGKFENTYRLRDWSIGRQRYWGVPIPVVYDPEGNAHPIPKEHLPWHLPTDVDHTPTGEPPLSKSNELRERVTRIFGEGWTPDYETMDTFVDSSWYFLRYLDNKNDSELSSKKAQEEWMPIDIYFGGAEHTTMHLLYSRFWQKALHKLGLVTVDEPYKKRINRGLVLGPDGNKMSKSKGNVIDPDEQVKNMGADTVKMYLAFMGPYGETTNYPWDLGGIAGIRRFLERVYGLREHIHENESKETTKLLHKTIKKVRSDIELYKFNTAISSLMVFVNHVEKHGLLQSEYETFLTLLAPFAPHLTEELWHEGGHTTSIHLEPLPVADESLVKDDVIVVGVQINGKMRGTISIPPDAKEEEALRVAQDDPTLGGKLRGSPKKIIYVPGRILNLILEE